MGPETVAGYKDLYSHTFNGECERTHTYDTLARLFALYPDAFLETVRKVSTYSTENMFKALGEDGTLRFLKALPLNLFKSYFQLCRYNVIDVAKALWPPDFLGKLKELRKQRMDAGKKSGEDNWQRVLQAENNSSLAKALLSED